MTTHSRAITITGDSPHAGWDLHVSHIEHDVDQMDDLYTLALWAPGATEPTHQFDTYRHGYGWSILAAALTADDEHVDDRMQAVADWWAQHHTTEPHEIHRILVAVDDTTWATRDEITQRLAIDPDNHEAHDAVLAQAAHHGLITWHTRRDHAAYAALTPVGYDLLHPADQASGEHSQQRLTAALADHGERATPPPAAGRAFPPITRVPALPAIPSTSALRPAPSIGQRTHHTR
jgi:hypothetical protein